jgi:hypothetical protein
MESLWPKRARRNSLLLLWLFEPGGSPTVSLLGIAEFIVSTGSFFHAQIHISFYIIEELSPKMRMIPFPIVKNNHFDHLQEPPADLPRFGHFMLLVTVRNGPSQA